MAENAPCSNVRPCIGSQPPGFFSDERLASPGTLQQSLCCVRGFDQDFSRACKTVAICFGCPDMELPDNRNPIASKQLSGDFFVKCAVGSGGHQLKPWM